MITKAVILAGGKGTRLANPDIPKSMVMLNGKPVLANIFSILKKSGITEVFLIVNYLKDQIVDYFGNEYLGIKINYLDDGQLLKLDRKPGIADVLGIMDQRINEPFVMMLGDEVYIGTDHESLIKSFDGNPIIGVMHVSDPDLIKKNYTLSVDDYFNVFDLEEKPEAPWNDLLGCGTYIFTPDVFTHIRNTPLSSKTARKEITDTLKVIASNGVLRAFDLRGHYVNINYPDDIFNAEELFRKVFKSV